MNRREYWLKQVKNVRIFLLWATAAVLVGIIVGGIGIAFQHILDFAAALRERYNQIIFLLPIAGVLIVFIYKLADMPIECGTNYIFASIREDKNVRFRFAPAILLSTILTRFAGGSAGAPLQFGGAISSKVGELLRLNRHNQQTITMCGMAGSFSTLLGTPLAAATFTLEAINVGAMNYAALFPCLLTAVTSHMLSKQFGGTILNYSLLAVPQELSAILVIKLIVFGIICAVISSIICIVFQQTARFTKKYFANPYLMILIGSILLIILLLFAGTKDFSGSGVDEISQVMLGQVGLATFAVKLILTAITMGFGFKGGEIVPVLFMGAAFGSAYGVFFGFSPSFAAALGMVAVFCGATNAPLTAILLAFELFGGVGLLMFAIVITVSYMLSGYYGLYSEQMILFSKMRPERINRKIK